MATTANQNIVIIKKTPCKSNFLQINNDEWMQAAKSFKKPNTFKLYIYLAANEIEYKLALSKVAVENALGIGKTSYYDGIKELKDLGYLVDIGGNKLEFYTSPFRYNGKEEKDKDSATAESIIVEKNPNSARAENVINTFNF